MLWWPISKSRKKRPSNSVFMRRAGHSHLKTLVHRKLTQILHRESSDPRFEGITISRVETSPDLSFARVLVSHAEHRRSVIRLLLSDQLFNFVTVIKPGIVNKMKFWCVPAIQRFSEFFAEKS